MENQNKTRTDFSISSILSLFKEGRTSIHSHQKCFWVNKLGELCLQEKNPDSEGAKFLLNNFVLNECEEKKHRATALCYLILLGLNGAPIDYDFNKFKENEVGKELFREANLLVDEWIFREGLL